MKLMPRPTALVLLFALLSCNRIEVNHLDSQTSEILLKKGQTVLLPIQDSAPAAVMFVYSDTTLVGLPSWIHFSRDSVDYVLPYTAQENVRLRLEQLPQESEFFSSVRLGKYRSPNEHPYLHFKPRYGWINDPNGLVYKDGLWHLYYQYNQFSTTPGCCDWGHATSSDLLHWEHRDVAICRGAEGEIWSGSAAVKGDSVVAIYTACTRESQSQHIAFSTDGGNTFEKYDGNPVISLGYSADFRDPKIFWYEPQQKWITLVAHFDVLDIYSSVNLKDWTLESSFGRGIGGHQSCWECPDMFTMPYGDGRKWIVVVSCRRNDIVGQATQYFIGEFDGHEFIPDDVQERWFDDGRDNYAAVTWSNAPDDRRVMIGWMGNWWYSHQIPSKGWRGMMTTPRELTMGEYNGRTIIRSYPVKEVLDNVDESFVIRRTVTAADPDLEIYGLKLHFDFTASLFTIERAMDGCSVSCLEDRPEHELLVIKADGGVECFIDGGGVCMTVISRLSPDENK